MRTSRTNGTTIYSYVYNGSQLVQMVVGSDVLRFAYDATGTPLTVTYNGTTYYYTTNLQGDVVAIVDVSGTKLVEYTYSGWGVVLQAEDVAEGEDAAVAETLAELNPLRYRGYVYDTETALYYLQSRYYDPEVGRFINADNYPSTGQDFSGNNMFAYCGNNPVSRKDDGGEFWNIIIGAVVGAVVNAVITTVAEVADGTFEMKDLGKIGVSFGLGAVEGALTAIFPAAAPAISALSSATESAIHGVIDGNSSQEIIADSLISGAFGAISGTGGSTFVKGNKIVNNAGDALITLSKKVLHPTVKTSANKTLRKGAKYILKESLIMLGESSAYTVTEYGITEYGKMVFRCY